MQTTVKVADLEWIRDVSAECGGPVCGCCGGDNPPADAAVTAQMFRAPNGALYLGVHTKGVTLDGLLGPMEGEAEVLVHARMMFDFMRMDLAKRSAKRALMHDLAKSGVEVDGCSIKAIAITKDLVGIPSELVERTFAKDPAGLLRLALDQGAVDDPESARELLARLEKEEGAAN